MWTAHRVIHTSGDCGRWVRQVRGCPRRDAIHRLWANLWRSLWTGAVARRSARGFDLDVDARVHVGVQTNLQIETTEFFDRLGQLDLAAIDLGAGLAFDRLRDVVVGDRTEQSAFTAGT